MAGGSKVAFTLGSMSQGGGIKGAAAGIGAVAQAGVMSVAKAGGRKALAAGGAVSTAHGNGMRGGMRALSKGMKSPTAGSAKDAGAGAAMAKDQIGPRKFTANSKHVTLHAQPQMHFAAAMAAAVEAGRP